MKNIARLLSGLVLCAGLILPVSGQAGAPTVSLALSNQAPKPGEPVHLTFQVKQGSEALTDFDVVHEKTSHLILVSSDYTDFQHVHPDLDDKGTFTIRDVVFKKPGPYYVFMDVTPQGSRQIVKRFEVPVQGKAAPLVLKEDTRDLKAADMRIRLKTMPARLKKGDAMLHFELTRDGKPVTNITPFMGAMGHVIAMGKDGAPFLHIHPMETAGDGHAGHGAPAAAAYSCPMHPEVTSDKPGVCPKCNMKLTKPAAAAYSCPMHPEVTSDKPGVCPKCNMKLTKPTDAPPAKPGEVAFHATFPAAGLYRVWGQFQVGDAMVIAPFTVKVQ
jgi:hypothetical protein